MMVTVTNNEKITTSEPSIINHKTTKVSADLSKDVAQKVASLNQLAPDWTYRRKLIFASIYFCGAILGLISASLCIGLLMGYFHEIKSPVDNGLINLAETIIYTVTFFASSIVGAYCFGVAFETNSYRAHMTNMVTSIATSSPSSKRNKNARVSN